MLYWLWSSVFLLIGIALAYRSGVNESNGVFDGDMMRDVLSMSSFFVAVFFSWPVLWSQIWGWLDDLLPQAHTDLHNLTAGVLMTIFLLGSIVILASVCQLLGLKLGGVFRKRGVAS